MKKLFLILIPLLFFGCSNLNGPNRNILIENKTDKTITFTILVNNQDIIPYTLQPYVTNYLFIQGGYQIKNLNFRYSYNFYNDNHIYIKEADKVKYTIINHLPTDITLKDRKVEEFSQTINSNSVLECNMYYITHDFYLNDINTNTYRLEVSKTEIKIMPVN